MRFWSLHKRDAKGNCRQVGDHKIWTFLDDSRNGRFLHCTISRVDTWFSCSNWKLSNFVWLSGYRDEEESSNAINLGRPFLATASAIMDWPNMKISFTNIDKNIFYKAILAFQIAKQSPRRWWNQCTAKRRHLEQLRVESNESKGNTISLAHSSEA